MMTLITPFEYGILIIGLIASVVFGVVVGIGGAVWSSLRKRGK